MLLNEWIEQKKELNYHGHRLAYWRSGSGPCLICLHGFPTSSFDWVKLWDRLSLHFDVVAIDFLGMGLSDKLTNHSYSIQEQAKIVDQLVQHLGVKKVHLLAHDYGDSVGQEILALAHEKNFSAEVASICFLNGGLFPEAHRAKFIQKLLCLRPFAGLAKFINFSIFDHQMKSIMSTHFTRSESEDHWKLVSRENGHHLAHQLLQYIPERKIKRDRWLLAMKEFSQKMLFIIGSDDPISGKHMGDRACELLPGRRVSFLDGVGHYPHWEAPEKVWDELKGFYQV